MTVYLACVSTDVFGARGGYRNNWRLFLQVRQRPHRHHTLLRSIPVLKLVVEEMFLEETRTLVRSRVAFLVEGLELSQPVFAIY